MSVELICASHSPLMSYVRPPPAIERAVEEARDRLRAAVAAFAPELVVVFGPDHFNGLFYDMMPPLAVGVRAASAEDYDMPPGDLGVPEPTALALVEAARADDIDVAVSYRMRVDHGFTQTLVMLGLFGRVPTIPVFINAAAAPLPSCRRARLLGASVGRFLGTLSKRILVIGSGGLSHDPPTPQLAEADEATAANLLAPPVDIVAAHRDRIERVTRAAADLTRSKGQPLNPVWDKAMLDLFAQARLNEFDRFDDAAIRAEGGRGGHEIRTWIAAFAALDAGGPYTMDTRFYAPIPEWLIGCGLVHARPN